MENFLFWLFYFVTFYAFLPGMISRTFGFRVFKKGKAKHEIALTFDDGPDSVYTPKLLDLLKRYNAKATFFVVGSHAEGNASILQRMKAEGHQIGIHNYEHKSNWLMRPKTVRRHIEQTTEVIEKATGDKSIYYRPPWGIVNLFDYSNLGHLQIILWSAMFGDWRIKLGAKRLEQRMMKKLRPGEVLLLHDCGRTFGADPDAPANMLQALEAYMEEGHKRGYRFVAIDEMIRITDAEKASHVSIWKRMLISLWLGWEQLFHFTFRLKKVGESETPAFHYRVINYSGEQRQFANGEKLHKGDKVVELHFDNQMLSSIAAKSSSPVTTGIRMLREVEHALPDLADQIAADPQTKGFKAVYGVTMIHRGADRLGFELFKLPDGLFARSTRIYLRILVSVLTNGKKQSAKSRKRRETITPMQLFMPDATISRYRTAWSVADTAALLEEDETEQGESLHLDDALQLDKNRSVVS